MSRALKNQILLSVVSRIVATPASPSFANIQRADFRRNFTTAILRRAPTGFSVSFAPEPDEPETEASAPSKAPTKNGKGKRKSTKKATPAQKAKPQQKYISEDGSNKDSDNTQAVAVLGGSSSNSQAQETHCRAEGEKDLATGGSLVADAEERTVEVGPEDSLLILHRLSTEALASKDHLKAPYEGSESIENWNVEKETKAEFPVDPEFFRDDTPIKRQTPLLELAGTKVSSISEGTKRGKKPRIISKAGKQETKQQQHQLGGPDSRSSLSQEGEDPLERDPTSKVSKAQPRSQIDIQAKPSPPRKKEPWQAQKQALEKKFDSEGWSPRKKLSPDTIDGIRALHGQYPDEYPTPVLAEKFKISPEAIRRILKSKWRPDPDKQGERRERWARRHDRIWDQQAAIGLRPARTKVKKPKEPSDQEGEAEIGALEVARARTRAREVHLTDEG